MLFRAYGGGDTPVYRRTNWILELLLALVAAGVAFGIRVALDPVLGPRQPYTPSFGAIAVAAWFGGWRAGSITACASYLLAQYFFVEPRHTLHLGLADVYGGASYWLIAIVAIYLAHRARSAIHALHQASSQKDQFIAIVAHELRNPLATAGLAVQMLQARSTPGDPVTASATILARQIDHMKLLIRDLTELSRIADGKMALNLAPTPIQQCLDDAVNGNKAAIMAKGQELTVVAPPEQLDAIIDGVRVTQIISNLINNASKYSPPGAHIAVTVALTPAHIGLTVKDDGPGIPANRMETLFERPSSSLPKQGDTGLGIGLWLSRHLAELHGGALTGHNVADGHGAEFHLSLPVATHSTERPVSAPVATAKAF